MGDCAETFQECHKEQVDKKLQHVDHMATLLEQFMQKKIIKIGRIAGQYAKPRSCDFEIINNSTSFI